MINITVKTLDSQNHHYSVEDDITVKQFKEKIAAEVDIPASRQRLIYCGRVLQDDKPLKDYDVHEKAVHLVARPPPQTASQQQQQSQRQPSSGRGISFGPPPIARPGPNSSTVRMNNAKKFLQNVSTVLEQIDNGGATEAAAAPQTETSASEASQSPNSSRVSPQPEERTANGNHSAEELGASPFSQIAQVAQQAVMSAAMSAARSFGNNIFMQIDGGEGHVGMLQLDVGIERTGDSAQNMDSSSATTESTTESAAAPPTTEPQQETPPQRPPRPRTSAMVEVLDELLRVTRQLQPYIERCRTYLHEDQDFANNEEAANNAQRCYNRVCEALHLMAHAQHAISDLDVDFHSAPPRHLRSQYILLSEPTAIFQAGVPMQINLTTTSTINRGSRGQPTSSSETTATTQSQPTSSSESTRAASESGAAADKRSETSRTTTAPTTTTSSSSSSSSSRAGGFSQNLLFGPVGNPNHGHVIIGNSAPGEFVQDMMSAIAQHYSAPPTCGGTIEVRLSSSSPTTQTASTSQARPTVPSSQNSQARVNTATNPTMSTQTRSTSRPHVHHHFHPMHAPMPSSSFDAFLPCNSHHVRRPSRHVFRTHTVTRTETASRASSDSVGERIFRRLLQLRRLLGSNDRPIDFNSTLLEVLRGYTIFTPDGSLVSDLLVLVAENVNAGDIFHPPFLYRLQEKLRDFVSRRVMMGREPTDENLDAGVQLILDSLSPHAIQKGMQVRENIDFVASVKNLLKERVRELLKMLTQKEPVEDSRFEDGVASVMSDTVNDLIILCMLCHQDRRGAIRQVFMSNLRHINPTSLASLVSQTMERVRARMRNLTEDRVQSYVIRLPVREPKATQTKEPAQAKAPEPMETDMVDGDTSWHRVVPSEWIPVITADVGRQRRLPSQPESFSDAYITGMPCKRRRISRSGHNTQELLSESLRRALSVSGLTPASGGNSVLEDARQDQVLGAAFREHLRGELDERVRNDPDYSSERFPNTHAFMKR